MMKRAGILNLAWRLDGLCFGTGTRLSKLDIFREEYNDVNTEILVEFSDVLVMYVLLLCIERSW